MSYKPPKAGCIHMYGHYEASVVVHHQPADLVASWLPKEMELGPQDVAPDGMHPTVMLFGVERRVGLTPFPPIFAYNEWAMVVPFTKFKERQDGYHGPFLWTPCLFVTGYLIALGGDILYGFPKRLADFDINDGTYRALDKEVLMPYVQAEMADTGTEPDAAQRLALANLIQQPSISQKKSGKYIGSGFWWNLGEAKLANQTVEGELVSYLEPGCRNGSQTFKEQGSSDFSKGGAVRMVTEWTLTLPGSPHTDWSDWRIGPAYK